MELWGLLAPAANESHGAEFFVRSSGDGEFRYAIPNQLNQVESAQTPHFFKMNFNVILPICF
jgi:hypothetical protein